MAIHRVLGSGGTHRNLCISGARDEHTIRQNVSEERRSVIERNECIPASTDERPKHPDYLTLNKRVSSFSGWNSAKANPNDLAEAGFFFTGTKDYVRCFFCGGGIKDWDTGDYPWIEHARWYPNCDFLKQSKGDEFIRLCQSSNISDRQQCENLLSQARPQEIQLVENQLIADLQTTAARLVLDMGYTQDNVIQAIRYARQTYGSEELRAHHLLEYLLDNFAPISPRNSTTNSSSRSAQVTNSGVFTNVKLSSHSNESSAKEVTVKESEPLENLQTPSDGLLEENRQLKEQKICKICLDKEACIVFIPCGHLVTCIQCSQTLRKCAICRANIQDKIRAYPS